MMPTVHPTVPYVKETVALELLKLRVPFLRYRSACTERKISLSLWVIKIDLKLLRYSVQKQKRMDSFPKKQSFSLMIEEWPSLPSLFSIRLGRNSLTVKFLCRNCFLFGLSDWKHLLKGRGTWPISTFLVLGQHCSEERTEHLQSFQGALPSLDDTVCAEYPLMGFFLCRISLHIFW